MKRLKAFLEKAKVLLIKTKKYLTYDRILLFGIILLILLVSTCNKRKRNEALKGEQESAQIWSDMFGNEHAKVKQLTQEKEDMKRQVDSIAEVLKIKPKTITKYVKAKAKIDTTVKGSPGEVIIYDTIWADDGSFRIDTVKEKTLDFVDTSKVPSPLEIHAKGDSLSVKVDIDLSVVDYYKRTRVLGLRIGKKVHYTDIGTNNPYVKFNGAESYKKVEKPPLKLRTGFGLGLSFNPITGKVTPGITIGAFFSR